MILSSANFPGGFWIARWTFERVLFSPYHQCRKWNIEGTAVNTCYLDWTREKTSRCWIHQRGSCFTPNTPSCHLHNKRFNFYYFSFPRVADDQLLRHIYLNTKKHFRVDQRLSRLPWKRQEITHKRSCWAFTWGTAVSRGNQCPGWSLLAVQPHTSGVPFPGSASAFPSWMPTKNFGMYSHLEWDRENPKISSCCNTPHPIKEVWCSLRRSRSALCFQLSLPRCENWNWSVLLQVCQAIYTH